MLWISSVGWPRAKGCHLRVVLLTSSRSLCSLGNWRFPLSGHCLLLSVIGCAAGSSGDVGWGWTELLCLRVMSSRKQGKGIGEDFASLMEELVPQLGICTGIFRSGIACFST